MAEPQDDLTDFLDRRGTVDERKRQILQLFREALVVPAAQRAAFLEQSCGHDQAMRVVIESMINQYVVRKLARQHGADETALAFDKSAEADPLIGKRIGDFHIRRHIDSGGMGRVYEAVQQQPHRVVALKVMLRGIASRSALHRLKLEAQLLGRLRHPGIAQVYQAGTFDDGFGQVPYFAMEYIPNAHSLTDFAKRSDLSTRSRLELFVKVCEAVHHGHQRGIIHRDLKPDNIIVDSARQPKIIDFGVARSTDSDLAVTTLQTEVGQLIGTLQYMSPEQCDADPHDIDARSDVYSLGVVLYELLCGSTPYEVSGVPIHDAARMIRETLPPRLSSIDPMLGGDLETIVLKALEKDRSVRYHSALELAQDLDHYLAREDIRARRPGVIQYLARLARRHRPMVAATSVIFAVLLAATAVSFAFYLAARDERDVARVTGQRALDERDRATQVEKKALRQVYAYDIAAASEALRHGDRRAVSYHLSGAPEDFRGWEHGYLRARLSSDPVVHILGSPVQAVAASRDGTRLAFGLRNGVVAMWDRATSQRIEIARHAGPAIAIALSADGASLASSSIDLIRVWDVSGSDSRPRFTDRSLNTPVRSAAFSGNGEYLVVTAREQVRIWVVASGARLWTIDRQERRERFADPASRDRRPMVAAFNHDGTRLAVGGHDGVVELWYPLRRDRRPKMLDLHRAAVLAATFDAEGSRLASAAEDATLQVFDLATWDSRPIEPGHGAPVRSLAFNEVGTRLASGSDDTTVQIWDVETQTWVITLSEHRDVVRSVAFCENGRVLVSCADDGTLRLWESAGR